VLRRSIVLVLAAALLAAGCGGNSRREDVASYVERVNSIQISLRQPLGQLAQANREFSLETPTLIRARPRLVKSEAAIQKLDDRLRDLDPPPDARRLHELLLQLVASEATLTHELWQTSIYLPELQVAIKPLSPAATRLRDALAGEKSGDVQAKALDAYGAALEAVATTIRSLEPPALLMPVQRSQLQTLARARKAAAALAAALRRKDAAAVQKLAREFQQASLSGDSVSAQQARIAGIKGYNGRVKAVRRLAASVGRERDRLQRTLK
jgi:hypothetical protein